MATRIRNLLHIVGKGLSKMEINLTYLFMGHCRSLTLQDGTPTKTASGTNSILDAKRIENGTINY